jgi:murein DD-endopeptidase MepM/ murein hydrolase activator NlpD
MKRVASCLAALTALTSTGVCAKAASIRCTSHHEVIQNGDNAMGLALRSDVSATQFARWLERADASTRRSLKQMQPGDGFDVCVASLGNANNALMSVRIKHDQAGRKRAEHGDPLPPLADHLFAGVIGDAVTTARPMATTPAAQPALAEIKQTGKTMLGPLMAQLTPGHLLSDELTRHLGHHPVVAAVIDYAQQQWHLPKRLPKDSHCTLALLPANTSGSRMQLAYIQIDYRGRHERIYHYVDSHGRDFMMGAHGQGYRVVDPLLPVSDARISSGWGWRTQPVLGGNEFHQGIDYAAPSGTPVRATMDGVVDIYDWRGNYGRLVEIKHTAGLSTRYGHLSAFAANVKIGSHVSRGQVIGYVGASGLSTGPHLYYEVWDHGVRVNPLVHKQLMVTASLSSHERQRFSAYINRIAAP